MEPPANPARFKVNVPVACGGVVVHPGDVVIGGEEGIVVVPRRWAGIVADSLGDTGHANYEPGTIRDRLAALPKDVAVPGLDRVHGAVRDRRGVIHDGTYEEMQGP